MATTPQIPVNYQTLAIQLYEALFTMYVATSGEEPEKFPGHHAAYLRQVALPRARVALATAEIVRDTIKQRGGPDANAR